MSDNGQLVSDEFRRFAEEWEFKHVMSSLEDHKASGQAESAVKVTKNLLTKALQHSRDPWLALLEYRNMYLLKPLDQVQHKDGKQRAITIDRTPTTTTGIWTS